MINCKSLGMSLNLSILISDQKNKYEVLSTGEGTGCEPYKLLVMLNTDLIIYAIRRWEALYNERHPHKHVY